MVLRNAQANMVFAQSAANSRPIRGQFAANLPPHEPWLHWSGPSHVQRFLRVTNLFKTPFERGSRLSTAAFFNGAAIATAFGMLIVLVC